MESKTPKESLATMTELILPNDTNMLHNLMGGKLMHWMDIVSAISAQRHSGRICVTASVDNVSFSKSIPLGSIVSLEAKVTRAFNTSMEVHIIVTAEQPAKKMKFISNEAFFTFVAINDQKQKVHIPAIVPETEEEKALYDSALRRRQLRLILAKKMKPNDATELKALFTFDSKLKLE